MRELIERLRMAAKILRDIGGQSAMAATVEEAAAALEAEQRGRIVGSRSIDGLHVIVASAFTPGVEEQLLVRYDHYLAALEAAREDASRWRWLRREVFHGDIPVGEARLILEVTGSCPSLAELDAAIDQARGTVPEAGQGGWE